MKQIGKYKGLLDMINGGGAAAEGDKFEGGGLLSAIANAIATPYGSEDRMGDAMQEQRPMARPSGGFDNGSANSVAPEPVYSGRGNVGMPMPESQMPLTKASDIPGGFNFANAAPVQAEGSGMTPASNYVPSSMPFDPSAAVDFTMPDGSLVNPPAGKVSFFEFLTNLVGAGFEDQFANNPQSKSLYEQYINQQ